MEVSCAFPTALDSPDNIALAERMGYDRAWVYDTPQQSPDVWMTLALAAERTERIGLGPGVLVPSLRHPMVNAAATATLAALAPGRVAISFGTGFSGRRAMGYRAIPWSYMKDYILAYRGLLRGEVVEWEGARMQMLHPDGHAPARPVDVPDPRRRARTEGRRGGPRARATASTSRCSCRSSSAPTRGCRTWRGAPCSTRPRPRTPTTPGRRAGPGWALAYHGAYEFGGPDAVRRSARRRARGWTSSSARPRTSATSPCTSGTASSSTRPTGRRGTRAATRCSGDVTISGTPGRDPRRDRRARRAGRHRDRVPAVRARRRGRARTVPGRRNRRERTHEPRDHHGGGRADLRRVPALARGPDLVRRLLHPPGAVRGGGRLRPADRGRGARAAVRSRLAARRPDAGGVDARRTAAPPRGRRHAGHPRRARRARRRVPERHGRRRARPGVRRQLRLRPDGRGAGRDRRAPAGRPGRRRHRGGAGHVVRQRQRDHRRRAC